MNERNTVVDSRVSSNIRSHDRKVNQLTLFHLNIQCLATKLDMLSLFLEDVDYDIICLSEHWQDKVGLNNLIIPNFTLQSAFCRDAHRH